MVLGSENLNGLLRIFLKLQKKKEKKNVVNFVQNETFNTVFLTVLLAVTSHIQQDLGAIKSMLPLGDHMSIVSLEGSVPYFGLKPPQ